MIPLIYLAAVAPVADIGVVAITTAGSVLVGLGVPFFGWLGVKEVRRRKLAAAEATPEAPSPEAVRTANAFEEGVEIHRLITEAVERAVAPLREELADLGRKLEEVQSRETRILTIVRRYFQRLLVWDMRGRDGDLPTPSGEEMQELDLEDIRLTS